MRMRVWSTVIDWLFPPSCPGCAATHPFAFCAACTRAIRQPSAPQCRCCGLPFDAGGDSEHLCSACLRRRPRFARARACAAYRDAVADHGPLERVLHRFKYGRALQLAVPLGRLFAERCPLPLADYDLIVPVPLHLRRLRWRGFNQAQLLAAALAARGDLAVDPFALVRHRPTPPQVGLDATARRRNVVGAFAVPDPFRVRAKRVLLVDDVYTSGATTNECSRVLRAAGARRVDVCVLARAL